MTALGRVFSALAALEDETGQSKQAVHLGETALRYGYLIGDVDSCAVGHFNLANYIYRSAGPPQVALAHRLAAVLIALQSGSGHLDHWLSALSLHTANVQPANSGLALEFP